MARVIFGVFMIPIWIGAIAGCVWFVYGQQQEESKYFSRVMAQAHEENYKFKEPNLKLMYEGWLRHQISRGKIND
jgi:hypothetical protein